MAPASPEGSGNFTQHEPIDALAHACAGTVFGRGHVHVMADVVLNAKVSVTDQPVGYLRGDAIGAAVLVAQFMTEQNRTPPLEPRSQRNPAIPPPRQRIKPQKPTP